MRFFDKIVLLKKDLENLGFEVFTPEEEGTETDYTKLAPKEQSDIKQNFIDEHIAKIKQSDSILVANYDKNGLESYIGANTFLEMAFAYILGKKIFLLNKIPGQPNSIEIAGLKPIALNTNLNSLNDYL